MQNQRIIIVANASYEKEYAEKLFNRIKTNYSEYSVSLWSEDEYKTAKKVITDVDKLIFFGKARKTDERAKDENIRGKFNKFGMKYGWAGNICVICASESDVSWGSFFGNFTDYCKEMNKKYSDVPIPKNNIFAEIFNDITKDKSAGYRCQYSALLHEFLDGGGFKGFIVKANPDAPAFKKIVEQLPDIKDYPDSSNTDHWETLEARDGYRIQINNGRRHNIFRILNRKNEPIAWGKRDYEQLGIMAFLSLFEERVIEIVDVADEKKKNGPLYQTIDSLKPIEELLEDASKALGDKSRTIKDSPLAAVLMSTWSEVAASFIGGSAGAALSFAVLYIGGKILGLKGAAAITAMLAKAGMLVGGGMFAGIFVFAMPVAILAAGGAIIVAKVKAEELQQEKERLLQKAIETQQAILAAMKIEIDAAKQRADYLSSLNELLRRAINDLRGDLKYAG